VSVRRFIAPAPSKRQPRARLALFQLGSTTEFQLGSTHCLVRNSTQSSPSSLLPFIMSGLNMQALSSGVSSGPDALLKQRRLLEAFVAEEQREFDKSSRYEPWTVEPPRTLVSPPVIETRTAASTSLPGTTGVFMQYELLPKQRESRSVDVSCDHSPHCEAQCRISY
jgi:hypothetical protein